MNEKKQAFSALLETEEVKEILSMGEKIKKLDKSSEKKIALTILLSVISMTVLGFISLGMTGSIIFFAVTIISSFWLYYSSKKNILLKYLTFYRQKIPKIIAMAEGINVISEDIPDSVFISTLSDGKQVYRMCHRYGDIYMGFLKFMRGSESILQGLVCYTKGDNADTKVFEEELEKEYPDFTVKVEGGKALLFITGVEDYLGGRVEMKDDLSKEALLHQYEYYLICDAFRKTVNERL